MAGANMFIASSKICFIEVNDISGCRDALSQLLGPVKLHLEELVIERCSDFLSRGSLHFSPLAAVSHLRVSNPLIQLADLSELTSVSAAKHVYKLLLGCNCVKAVCFFMLHGSMVQLYCFSKQTSKSRNSTCAVQTIAFHMV